MSCMYLNLHLLLPRKQRWRKKAELLGGKELIAPLSPRGEGKDDDVAADHQDCNFPFLVIAALTEH